MYLRSTQSEANLCACSVCPNGVDEDDNDSEFTDDETGLSVKDQSSESDDDLLDEKKSKIKLSFLTMYTLFFK